MVIQGFQLRVGVLHSGRVFVVSVLLSAAPAPLGLVLFFACLLLVHACVPSTRLLDVVATLGSLSLPYPYPRTSRVSMPV